MSWCWEYCFLCLTFGDKYVNPQCNNLYIWCNISQKISWLAGVCVIRCSTHNINNYPGSIYKALSLWDGSEQSVLFCFVPEGQTIFVLRRHAKTHDPTKATQCCRNFLYKSNKKFVFDRNKTSFLLNLMI